MRHLAAAAPQFDGHLVLAVLDEQHRLDIVAGMELLDAVDMAAVGIHQIEPIVGHGASPSLGVQREPDALLSVAALPNGTGLAIGNLYHGARGRTLIKVNLWTVSH